MKATLKASLVNLQNLFEVKVKKHSWDQLIGFGLVALVLWIMVQESPTAQTAANAIITAARTSVTALITGIGNF